MNTISTKKGFTLIELLMVVAIIGILSAVVLVSLANSRTKASEAATKEQLIQMRNRIQLLYESNNGSYLYSGFPDIGAVDCRDILEAGGGFGSVFEDSQLLAQYNALEKTLNVTSELPQCVVNAGGFGITGIMKSGKIFCMDGANNLRLKNTINDPYDSLMGPTNAPALSYGIARCN